MCLETNKKAKKLKKPKVIYKHAMIVMRCKDDLSDSTFKTVYQDFELRVGITYKADLGYQKGSKTKYEVHSGLHAFKNPNIAVLDTMDIWPFYINDLNKDPMDKEFAILKCIAPKGAYYASGLANGLPAHVASVLKVVGVVGVITKEKDHDVPTLYELEKGVFGQIMGGIYNIHFKTS
jgi:hypothetical protein